MMFVPHWKHRASLPGNWDSFTLLLLFLNIFNFLETFYVLLVIVAVACGLLSKVGSPVVLTESTDFSS
jgi:hypothetical protein